MPKYVVAAVDEIPSGGRKFVEVAGRFLGVFHVAGEYFAVLDTCPHQGGPLYQGQLWGAVRAPAAAEHPFRPTAPLLRCPLHAWEFDVRTGQSWFDPDKLRQRRFPVSLATVEAALQKGPYRAEAYPVTVEPGGVMVEI